MTQQQLGDDELEQLIRAHHFAPEGSDFPIRRVLHMISMGLDCDAVWIELANEGQTYIVAANRDVPPTWANPCGITAHVLSAGQAQEYSPLPSGHGGHNEFQRESGVLTLACWPLLGSGMKPIGALLAARHRAGVLNENDRKLISDGVRVIEDILSLRSESIRDPLTGCFNRRYFEQQLSQEARRSARTELPLTIAMIDVDRFKSYNDSAGHVAGDNALRLIGHALQESVRRAGDLPCRIGGEEFALVLPGTKSEHAQLLLERVAGQVRQLQIANPGNGGAVLTVSIGHATVTKQGGNAELQLLDYVEFADKALYRAKETGRDRVIAFDQLASDSAAD